MPNLLESLAGGLRNAGGILNPEVQKETFAADEANNRQLIQSALQRQQMMQQHLLNQATPQAQMQLEQLNNERNFRQAAAAAGGDQEQIVAAAMKYGKPELAVSIQKASEDRAARLEMAATANETKLAGIQAAMERAQNNDDMRRALAQQADDTKRQGQMIQLQISQANDTTRRLVSAMKQGQSGGKFTNVKEDADGSFIGLNTATGQMEKIPAAEGVKAKGGQLGNRESVFINRVALAANEAARDLENVVKLPMTSSSGFFGGRTQTGGLLAATREVLANKMTGQEAQTYNVMATGFQRSLASIESAGLVPSGLLSHQMDAVVFKEGDTNLTKLQKLAQTRQIIEAGLETTASNPRVPEATKQHFRDIIQTVQKAVPFTQSDLIYLQQKQALNPKATLKQVLQAKEATDVIDVRSQADEILNRK